MLRNLLDRLEQRRQRKAAESETRRILAERRLVRAAAGLARDQAELETKHDDLHKRRTRRFDIRTRPITDITPEESDT